jgi:pilus assembly protein CpaB
MNAEKTNRWLLIGAAVLAVAAGALVFAALANFGGDDEGGGSVSSGNTAVLVASREIAPGTQLTSGMFRVATFAEADVITDPVSNSEAIVGQVTSVRLLEGQQLSRTYIGEATSNDDLRQQLAFLVERGLRGIGLSVDDVTLVGGHAIPGDRVDVIWTVREKDNPQAEVEFLRIETLFQNIEVVARAENPVDGVVTLDADGNPKPLDASDKNVERRADDIDPADSAGTIVLALTPEQVQTLQMAVELGAITLSLRPFGDEAVPALAPIRVPVNE